MMKHGQSGGAPWSPGAWAFTAERSGRRGFLATSAVAAAGLALWRPGAACARGSEGGLPFRQVHLDFHTSEAIPDVAGDFDATAFARTLARARVASITVFAKCIHGWAYYDTTLAARHPALKIDLLGAMVEALHRAGIQAVAYYVLSWDALVARRHREWLQLDREGQVIAFGGGAPGVEWPQVCMNTPYLDQAEHETDEIVQRYAVDGLFYDILVPPETGCFCRWCVEERKAIGFEDTPADLHRHGSLVAQKTERRLTAAVRARRPRARVFYNGRVMVGMRPELPFFTHLEIESLPTGGWGYTHVQQRLRYARTLGKPVLGMTGRFHKSWGDFGGLKGQAALDYECLTLVANGAAASVGDQLHPRGRLDATTYERIGRTFARIEALEPWTRGARAVADIGVVSTAAVTPEAGHSALSDVDRGSTQMLLELHAAFDVLDLDADPSPYKVVVLPDIIPPSPGLTGKLEDYLSRGGALLVTHESLLDRETGRFALSALGVRSHGPSRFHEEYMLLDPTAFPDVDPHAYFLYRRGLSIEVTAGVKTLATYGHPYFDRTPEHYSSHRQAPLAEPTREPLVVQRGRVAYVANPFFLSYAQDAYPVTREVIRGLLGRLLPDPSLAVSGLPADGQATLLEREIPGGLQHVVHLLYYPRTRRAPDIDIVEEAGLVERVDVRVRRAQRPRTVTLVPEGREVPFAYEDGAVSFAVAPLRGHAAVAIE